MQKKKGVVLLYHAKEAGIKKVKLYMEILTH